MNAQTKITASHAAIATADPSRHPSDAEVIAHIRERGVVGPVPPAMIEAMRDRLAGEDFERTISRIAQDPVMLFRLLAEYRRAGLDDVAATIEQIHGPGSEVEPEPTVSRAVEAFRERSSGKVAWRDALKAYQSALAAQDEIYSQESYDEEEGNAISLVTLGHLARLLMCPAPSLDAMTTKLAIYLAEEACELNDADLFRAQLTADAATMARKFSTGRTTRPVVVSELKQAERRLSRMCDEDGEEQRGIIVSILREAVEAIDRKPKPKSPIQEALEHWKLARGTLASQADKMTPSEEQNFWDGTNRLGNHILGEPITCAADAAAKLRIAVLPMDETSDGEAVLEGTKEPEQLDGLDARTRQICSIIRELEELDA